MIGLWEIYESSTPLDKNYTCLLLVNILFQRQRTLACTIERKSQSIDDRSVHWNSNFKIDKAVMSVTCELSYLYGSGKGSDDQTFQSSFYLCSGLLIIRQYQWNNIWVVTKGWHSENLNLPYTWSAAQLAATILILIIRLQKIIMMLLMIIRICQQIALFATRI